MVGSHAIGSVLQGGLAAGAQQLQQVALLVLVVQRRRDGEIPQHVTRGGGHLRVGAMQSRMGDQALQKVERPAHAVVAGRQELERLVEARGGRRVQQGGHRTIVQRPSLDVAQAVAWPSAGQCDRCQDES